MYKNILFLLTQHSALSNMLRCLRGTIVMRSILLGSLMGKLGIFGLGKWDFNRSQTEASIDLSEMLGVWGKCGFESI